MYKISVFLVSGSVLSTFYKWNHNIGGYSSGNCCFYLISACSAAPVFHFCVVFQCINISQFIIHSTIELNLVVLLLQAMLLVHILTDIGRSILLEMELYVAGYVILHLYWAMLSCFQVTVPWAAVKHCCDSTSLPTFNIFSLFKAVCVFCEMSFCPYLFFYYVALSFGSSLCTLNTNYLLVIILQISFASLYNLYFTLCGIFWWTEFVK